MHDDPFDAWVVRDDTQTAPEHGPLAGLTFGVKDVIDVRGVPTRGGVAGEPPPAATDAFCVAALRAAGAIPAGKTRTTAHAFRDPTITRNPRAPGRTPGGSSSGSAAAVAAGEVPFALGTQTLGSTLRPAAFCGIVGYKPTYGLIPTPGVAPLAPSLDHVGVLARDVTTTLAVAHVYGVGSAEVPHRAIVAHWFLREYLDDESRAALDVVAAALPELGIDVIHREHVPRERETLESAHVVNAFEAARQVNAKAPTPALAELLARGAALDYPSYKLAREERPRALDAFDAFLASAGVAIVPVATAPPELSSTGDPSPQTLATFLGLPSISIPVGTYADGSPRGVQFIARQGADAMLLAFALAVERALLPVRA